MQGTIGAPKAVVRLAVYWGDRLLNVSQVEDARALTAGAVLGSAISAAGVSPHFKLFADDVHDETRVELGPLTLFAEPITAQPKLPSFTVPEDFSFFKIAMMTGLAMAAVLVTIALAPQDLPDERDDIIGRDIVIRKTTPLRVLELKPAAPDKERAKGREGEAGVKSAPRTQAPKQRTLGSKGGKPVGLLAFAAGEAFQKLIAPGNDVLNQHLGHLKNGAKQEGNANGFEGLGARHQGDGGGGSGDWTKIGGLGTERDGIPGGKGIELGGGDKRVVTPPAGPVRIVGGLSKEVIARVIKRHQSEIKFCYQSQLQREPTLAGKVSVMFTIDPVGAVSDAAVSESSLNNTTAEMCMLSKIRRWNFPAPEGGGVVSVNFPWVFSSAGASEE